VISAGRCGSDSNRRVTDLQAGDAPSESAAHRENRHIDDPRRDEKQRKNTSVVRSLPFQPSLDDLRTKLDAAIVAERWDAVAAIRARIVEVEREGVVDLGEARRARGRL